MGFGLVLATILMVLNAHSAPLLDTSAAQIVRCDERPEPIADRREDKSELSIEVVFGIPFAAYSEALSSRDIFRSENRDFLQVNRMWQTHHMSWALTWLHPDILITPNFNSCLDLQRYIPYIGIQSYRAFLIPVGTALVEDKLGMLSKVDPLMLDQIALPVLSCGMGTHVAFEIDGEPIELFLTLAVRNWILRKDCPPLHSAEEPLIRSWVDANLLEGAEAIHIRHQTARPDQLDEVVPDEADASGLLHADSGTNGGFSRLEQIRFGEGASEKIGTRVDVTTELRGRIQDFDAYPSLYLRWPAFWFPSRAYGFEEITSVRIELGKEDYRQPARPPPFPGEFVALTALMAIIVGMIVFLRD